MSERDRYWPWLNAAQLRGGGFVSAFAAAALNADEDNFRILLPALVQITEKYPYYFPPDETGGAA